MIKPESFEAAEPSPTTSAFNDKALRETQEAKAPEKKPTREATAIDEALSSHATSFSIRPWQLSQQDYEKLSTATDLRKLSLNYSQMRDEELAHIGKLTKLEELNLSHSGIGAGLKHLTPLKELRTLNLADCFFIHDGEIRHLQQLPKLENLDLTRSGLTNDGCRTLANMHQLKSLIMCNTDVTDDGVRIVKDLKLEEIGLGNKVTDAGLAAIPPTVKSVEIEQNSRADALSRYYAQKLGDGPGITAAGIDQLAKTHPNLEKYYISGGPAASDAGMRGVGQMKNLKWLSVGGDVTNAGVSNIANLEHLERLFLSGHKFTNDAAKSLLSCKKLQDLTLAGLGINDDVIPTLAKMQGLKSLRLDCTDVTDRGIEQLKKLLPNCTVHDIHARVGRGNAQ
jgi:Leucine-rich repeat (LRR) protein